MRLHRLADARYADLSGIGGKLHPRRWTSGGRHVVYLASSCALALNEVMVNLDVPADLMPDYVHVIVEVPDDVWEARETVPATALPSTWRALPYGPDTQAIGDAWLAEDRSALLEVPSAVVPSETNALLNPLNAEAEGCTIVSAEPFEFDDRLLR